jgi:hypothetical protein
VCWFDKYVRLLAKRLQGHGDAHHARGQQHQGQRDASNFWETGRRRSLGPVRDVRGAAIFAVGPLLVAANGRHEVALALGLVEGRDALAVLAPAKQVTPVAPTSRVARIGKRDERCETRDVRGRTWRSGTALVKSWDSAQWHTKFENSTTAD